MKLHQEHFDSTEIGFVRVQLKCTVHYHIESSKWPWNESANSDECQSFLATKSRFFVCTRQEMLDIMQIFDYNCLFNSSHCPSVHDLLIEWKEAVHIHIDDDDGNFLNEITLTFSILFFASLLNTYKHIFSSWILDERP